MGRWGPSWRHFQAEHYSFIDSKKSSLRWATALILKLLITAWDFWQYRNDRLHAPAGPRALALHSSLNDDISAELAQGVALLIPPSRYLFDTPFADLQQDSLEGKRQWLCSVRAAKHALAEQHGTPRTAPSAQANQFRTWLGLSTTPPTTPRNHL